MKYLLVITLLIISTLSGFRKKLPPRVEILTSGTNTSIRGLSVVNNNVIWVSGSNGMVGKSMNAGKNWNWMTVKGFEKTEFRDIEAFDANTAIIMAVDAPAYILRTTDGGNTWKMVYENKTKGMFLDAMDFSTPLHGLVVGDPINKKPFLAETLDGGATWKEKEWPSSHALIDSGEAFFAASGSNIRLFENQQFYMVSGGLKSRLFNKYSVQSLPIMQGKESTGANSVDIFDDGIPNKPGKRMIVVGGDFNEANNKEKNCFYTTDAGKSWKAPKTPPNGYRSCVEYLSKQDILCCGINGVDYSRNGGKEWTGISTEGFNVCRIARIGSSVFLAGNKGKIAKLVWE